MIRYSLIVILCILLGISSYLIYKDQYVTINLDYGPRSSNQSMVQGGEDREELSSLYSDDHSSEIDTPKPTTAPDISQNTEELEEGANIEIHLDPTIGVDINQEQKIASSYTIIGPREFALLTDKDEPMVEIDLETGKVTIGSDYELDQVTTEFWNSIAEKYPEVCFTEKNSADQPE